MSVSSDGFTLTHKRNGDWDSARASPWITTGKMSVIFKVKNIATNAHTMIGAIKKDGAQWNNHVNSGKVDDVHPDGWVWYAGGGRFYNYSPDSGTYKRWGHSNIFKTNDTVRVYLDMDKKQVFILNNGYPVVSWTNIRMGEGVSVGCSMHNVNSQLTIMSQVPGS